MTCLYPVRVRYVLCPLYRHDTVHLVSAYDSISGICIHRFHLLHSWCWCSRVHLTLSTNYNQKVNMMWDVMHVTVSVCVEKPRISISAKLSFSSNVSRNDKYYQTNNLQFTRGPMQHFSLFFFFHFKKQRFFSFEKNFKVENLAWFWKQKV